MRAVVHGLGRMVLLAIAAAAVTAAVRALVGRLAGEPGVSAAPAGSFDTWPAVPVAPGRQAPNGSRVPAGS